MERIQGFMIKMKTWKDIKCECCKTNDKKNKQAKYCKNCSNFLSYYIHTRLRCMKNSFRAIIRNINKLGVKNEM